MIYGLRHTFRFERKALWLGLGAYLAGLLALVGAALWQLTGTAWQQGQIFGLALPGPTWAFRGGGWLAVTGLSIVITEVGVGAKIPKRLRWLKPVAIFVLLLGAFFEVLYLVSANDPVLAKTGFFLAPLYQP